MRRTLVVVVPFATCLVLSTLRQDPQREAKPPQPPADAAPLPPVQEPFRTKVERDDLLQRFSQRSVLEGFYRLRRMLRPGQPEARVDGYLWIGRRHLMLQLVGGAGDIPALQSGVRQYRISGDVLVMSALIGFRNDADGDIKLDPKGMAVRRRYTLLGPVLRVHREGGTFMEFERVE